MNNILKLKPQTSGTASAAAQQNLALNQSEVFHQEDIIDAHSSRLKMLEQQVDALFVVSKRLDTKGNQSSDMLAFLKNKIASLADIQNIDKAQFVRQYDEVKLQIQSLAGEMQHNLAELRHAFQENQQKINHQLQDQIDENLHRQESGFKALNEKQDTLAQTQSLHGEQINELRSITGKLTGISEQLSQKSTLHDEQIHLLQQQGSEQQQNINALFDKSHELFNKQQDILHNQDVFEKDITSLNDNQDNLFKHTSVLQNQQNELKEKLELQNASINRRFRISHWFTALAFAGAGSFLTAFYMQNDMQINMILDQTQAQQSEIVQLHDQSAQNLRLQTAMSRQIGAIEQQLSALKQSFANNEIDQLAFEQRQDMLSMQLSQLAETMLVKQQALNNEMQNNLSDQEFYKRIQFIRKDNQPVYDHSWIEMQNSRHYTVQVMSSINKSDIVNFLKVHPLEGAVAFRVSQLDGTTWYSIVNGVYPEYQQALTAAAELPDAVKPLKPWVRNFSQLKKTVQ